MTKNKYRLLNRLGETVAEMLDEAVITDNEQHECGYHDINDLNEINRLRNALKKIANYGNHGRTTLHHWEVPSETKYGVEYKIKQLLNGEFTCECPSFTYKTGLDAEGHCKHQRDVIFGSSRNLTDLSYGLGAVEAHRRITEIAKEALIG